MPAAWFTLDVIGLAEVSVLSCASLFDGALLSSEGHREGRTFDLTCRRGGPAVPATEDVIVRGLGRWTV